MNIKESKRLTNTVNVGLNNFIILNQNGCRENLARNESSIFNLGLRIADNIFWPIGIETESKQKSGE